MKTVIMEKTPEVPFMFAVEPRGITKSAILAGTPILSRAVAVATGRVAVLRHPDTVLKVKHECKVFHVVLKRHNYPAVCIVSVTYRFLLHSDYPRLMFAACDYVMAYSGSNFVLCVSTPQIM